MMDLRTRSRRWMPVLTLTSIAMCLALLAATTDRPAHVQASPAQQAQTCSWTELVRDARGRFHVAGAFDSDQQHFYLYGGLDASGDVSGSVMVLDVSSANPADASHGAPRSAGLQRFGAAGAYRGGPNVPDDQFGVYFVGGADDEAEGEGDDSILFLPTGGANPGAPQQLNPAGSLTERLFAAAAYDPASDSLWVVGGIQDCAAADRPCRASNIPTRYLSWDSSGVASLNNGPSAGVPNGLYGHTMVHDPAGQRLLVFGGTKDGSRNERDVYQLDLSQGPDQATTWQRLATDGVAPSLSFHAAAYDVAGNRMLVTGGTTTGPQGDRENASRRTYALDLTQSPPLWQELSSGDEERVGGVAAWASQLGTVIHHGGRGRFRAGGSQNANGDSDSLNCQVDIPGPSATPVVSPGVTPTIPGLPQICEGVIARVPSVVINHAQANPGVVGGYGEPCNPNLAPGPLNPPRTSLGLRNPSLPFHPLFNGLVWKCGCP